MITILVLANIDTTDIKNRDGNKNAFLHAGGGLGYYTNMYNYGYVYMYIYAFMFHVKHKPGFV